MDLKTDWHCIELTKTVGWEPRDRDDDELESFEALIGWLQGRSVLDDASVRTVHQLARQRPDLADAALDAAHRARALIYELLTRRASGVSPDPGHVEELNRLVHESFDLRRLSARSASYHWHWTLDIDRLDRLIAPVVWSTAELLTSPEVERLRSCAADDCGWLFIDATKNRSRRWCTMSDCGNRAKVRRFRERQRES